MSLLFGCVPKDSTQKKLKSEGSGGQTETSSLSNQEKVSEVKEIARVPSQIKPTTKRFSKKDYTPADIYQVEAEEDVENIQSQILITETPKTRLEIHKTLDKRHTLDSEGRKFTGIKLKCAKGFHMEVGLCYTPCQDGDKGILLLCYKPCPEGYADDGLLCRKNASIIAKKSYGRGVGKVPGCSSSEERDAGLCYKNCREGYNGVGPVCWGACKDGYKNHPASCYKHIFSWYFKKSYGRGVGRVGNSCKSDSEKQAGLCYKKCSNGYTGLGPVCWFKCPDGYKDDGAICRKDLKVVAKKSYRRNVKIPIPIVDPKDVATPSAPLAKHVLIIGIDGLGSKNITFSKIKGKIPNIDFIKNNGAWTHNAYIDPMHNTSGPNWQGIFTGTNSLLSGVTGNKNQNGYGVETIFDTLYKKNPNAKIGLIYDWEWFGYSPLNIDKFYTFYHHYEYEKELSTDIIGREAVKYIIQNKPQLLFTYFGLGDIAGHMFSAGSDEYANTIIRIDYQIGKILDALDKVQILEETLVIIIADHGHTTKIKGHSSVFRPVPLYIMGPNIKKGKMKWKSILSTNRIRNNLVAPLVAFFLGLDRPDEWSSSVYRLLPYIYRP